MVSMKDLSTSNIDIVVTGDMKNPTFGLDEKEVVRLRCLSACLSKLGRTPTGNRKVW